MMTIELARDRVASFKARRVVVVGDVMLDEYVRGDVARVSPEAPVPVVELRERSLSPGGAANAAANIVSLGGHASIVGLVGRDAAGESLARCLGERGIDPGALVAADRPTTHKLRVVARTQQIVRVDVESRDPLTAGATKDLVDRISACVAAADAVVISDYSKGVVSDEVARACVEAALRANVPVIVDPKGKRFGRYRGATIVTPNVLELETATGITTDNEDGAVVLAGEQLLAELDGSAVLVTRGAAGMTLLRRGQAPLHMPTRARSVYDVTGAGDTVVAALTLALAARVDLAEALVLASHAASIAVARMGTVAVTGDELVASFA